MASVDPLTTVFWIRVATAIACGTVIGLERQIHGKPVGVRTCILICLGTALFVQLGAGFAAEHADRSRVLGQVVTGVGFIGAGVIIAREGLVKGVTTAAVIWLLAALGSAIGLDQFAGAMTIAIVAVVLLTGIERIESFADRLRGRPRDDEHRGG